jgi:two-component system, OmpR family, sensor histidine kinase CiaH
MNARARRAGPALRVAIMATLLVGAVYVAAAVILYFVAVGRLNTQADGRLTDMISSARADPSAISRTSAHPDSDGDGDDDRDPDQVPVYLWLVNGAGSVTSRTPGAPALSGHVPAAGTPVTVNLGPAGSYRLLSAAVPGGHLVAGLSRAGDLHTENLVLDGELVAGPLVLLAMFGGSLVVGLRALAPVEEARRRQLEFTADASHELRTPLSVIRAEVDVALSGPDRTAADYRDSLTRVQSESERMRRLVDDLLWLARFDSQPSPPADEPVDLGILAQTCADRFRAVGPAISAEIGGEPALISAPPEWMDRLAGVLMDNACRYAGPDGRVRIGVRAHGGRLTLTVEDSGPGIPDEDRPKLFDRFQRAEQDGPGAGLGLAIGDSIVSSTGGRWRVGTSPLGGALMEVSWRTSHRLTPQRTVVGQS